MDDFQITNCHSHSFTNRHVPRNYPSPLLRPFKSRPNFLRFVAWVARLLGRDRFSREMVRLQRFQLEGMKGKQSAIIDAMRAHYPQATRFVVLPMDMSAMGFGAPEADLRSQHDELAAMAADPHYKGKLIPFATIHPDAPGGFAELKRAVELLGFKGVKLYPRLGFPPDHPVLMKQVYPLAIKHRLPVMTHCSRGGVTARGLDHVLADRFCEPTSYIPVLRAFPGLKLCLAHFGGLTDWRDYVDSGSNPDAITGERNWQVMIREMICSGEFPNLYTDISYTLFEFEDFAPFLRMFLTNKSLLKRVLFGSDYYMTRQEVLSERAVCIRLRVALGETVFRQIAETNPAVWLGEKGEVPLSHSG